VNATFKRYGITELSQLGLDQTKPSCATIYARECSVMQIKTNSGIMNLLPKSAGNYCITELNLGVNFVGDKGLLTLIPVIAICPSLYRLTLRDNGLHNPTVIALCKTLAVHPGISIIDLSSNQYLCLDAGTALLSLVKKNTNIWRLSLQKTGISRELQKKIGDVVMANKKAKGDSAQDDGERSRAISKSQFFRVKGQFDAMDRDMSGRVSYAEFREHEARSGKQGRSIELTRAVFGGVDKNDDGKFDLVEYMMAAFKMSRADILYNMDIHSEFEAEGPSIEEMLSIEQREEIMNIFQTYDIDGNGWLCFSELKQALSGTWADGFLEDMDMNGDDHVSCDEFLLTMADYYL